MLSTFTENSVKPVTDRSVNMKQLKKKLVWIDSQPQDKCKDVLNPNEVALLFNAIERKYGSMNKVSKDNFLFNALHKSCNYTDREKIKRDDDYPFKH